MALGMRELNRHLREVTPADKPIMPDSANRTVRASWANWKIASSTAEARRLSRCLTPPMVHSFVTFSPPTNHYAQLPDDFYTSMPAEKVGERPRLIHANPTAAALIGLDPAVFADPRFCRKWFPATVRWTAFRPLAMVYSGHQFGVWAGQLGDGRALLIGQVRNRKANCGTSSSKAQARRPIRALAMAAR